MNPSPSSLASHYPKITVVTPSYNQGHFLEETLRSVVEQNYPNLEFFVLDGGSKDNSVEIIKKYERHITWWVSEKDKGQSDAINKGFRRSTGDILTWLNSDDKFCPGALMAVARFFQENPEFGAVIGGQEVIDGDGRLLDVKKSVPVNTRTILYSACAVPQPATLFTRKAWESCVEVDMTLQYQMDYDFFLRMSAAGVKFGTLKVSVAQFRLHCDSKSVSEYEGKVWAANRKIQDRHLKVEKRGPVRQRYMDVMKWVYRAKLYVMRAILRGSFVPFRGTRARKQSSR